MYDFIILVNHNIILFKLFLYLYTQNFIYKGLENPSRQFLCTTVSLIACLTMSNEEIGVNIESVQGSNFNKPFIDIKYKIR